MNDKINSINKEIEQERIFHQKNKASNKLQRDNEKRRYEMRMNFLRDKKQKIRQSSRSNHVMDSSYKNFISAIRETTKKLEDEIEKAIS